MKLIVNPHKIKIAEEEFVNEKEIDISKCEFEFAEEITNDFVKEAYFTLKGNTYKKIILNNECEFAQEALAEKGMVEIGVVAYKVDNEETIKRYNPSPVYFDTLYGSLKEASNSEPITPSEMEQFEQALNDGLAEIDEAVSQAENLDIDIQTVGDNTEVIITRKDGTTKEAIVSGGGAVTDVQKNGVSVVVDGVANVTVPTNTSDLNNNSDFVSDASYVHTDNNYTTLEKQKLAGIDLSTKQDTLVSGTNIKTVNNESLLGSGNITIESGGTDDYSELTNKPSINSVTLSGNKTSSDLGLANASDIPDVSGFITKDVDNLTNYYKTSETYNKTEVDNKISSVYKYKGTVSTYSNLPSSGMVVGDVYNIEQADSTHGISAGDNVAWTGSAWDKLSGNVDLSGYQTKIDGSHKLSSDLVDDTNNTNLFVTSTEKSTWNAKYDKPSGGIPDTDLSSAVQTSLGKADTAIQDISGKQDTLVSGTNIKTINGTSVLGSGDIAVGSTIYNLGSGYYTQLNQQRAQDIINIMFKNNLSEIYIDANQNGSKRISIIKASIDNVLTTNTTSYIMTAMEMSPTTGGTRIDIKRQNYNVTITWTDGQPIVSAFSNNGTLVTAKIVGNGEQQSWTPSSPYSQVPKQYVDDGISDVKVQYATMLTPNASRVGKIAQYTGTTDANYTNGYFYICVSDGQATPTYSWQQLNVQPSSGGGGGSATDVQVNGTSITSNGVANLVTETAYNSTTNKIATMSDVPSVTGKQDKTTITTDTSSTTPSQALANNNEYRYTQDLTSLTITLPATIDDDFIAWVVFNSGSTATSIVYPNTIKWSGDDVSNNTFVPVASKTYNICVWYDGINTNAVVRGV